MYYVQRRFSSAKKCTVNGSIYDSKFEGGYAAELALRQKAGEITKWEKQKTIPLMVNGYHVGDYKIDFVVYYPDGLIEYVETKGRIGESWKWKWKIFEANYSDLPNVKLTVVYQGKTWKPRLRKKV